MAVEFYRHALREGDVAACVRVLGSTFLTTGPVCREAEERLSEHLGVPHVVTLSSCTAALETALRAFGVGKGDEVIVPALTFVATATAVVHAGAKPVFADVEPDTGNLGPAGVARALSPKTKAVIPVHLYGHMADLTGIREVLGRKHVWILEDAAHCVEGSIGGKRPGQVTDAAAFSFYATKNLTCGEGGALAMRDPDLAARARRIRQHGMTASAAERYRGTGTYVHWDVFDLGIKANLPDVLAALLVEQVGRLEAQRKKREQVAKRYERAIDELEGWSRPSVRKGIVHARHLATAWAPPGRRDAALKAFAKRQIGVAVNWRALPTLTWFKRAFRLRAKDFPVAMDIGDRTISLPLWVDLEEDDVKEVCAALAEVAAEVGRG